MKVFLLAVIVLGITLGCIWWGSWYVNRMCDRLLGLLEDMSGMEVGDVKRFGGVYAAFEETWEHGEMWLHILVGHDAADMVKDLFVEMGIRYICGDELGFRVVLEKLCLQIEKIKEGERIVVDSIL